MEAVLLPAAPPLCRECRRRLSPRNGRRDAHRHCREKRRRSLEVDWRREAEEELIFLEDDALEVALADASMYKLEEGEEQNFKEYQAFEHMYEEDYYDPSLDDYPFDDDPDDPWLHASTVVFTRPTRPSRWQSKS